MSALQEEVMEVPVVSFRMDKAKRKLLFRTLKLAVGSSAAIWVAETLHLDYAASAGSIAFLTVVTTKWETIKLSLFRVITFAMSVVLAWVLFHHVGREWIVFGVYVFAVSLISELLGWKATVSVNIVIGTHFLATMDITREFIWNELMLVLIGITIAIILNLFHGNDSQEQAIVTHMRDTEQKMQDILVELAAFLLEEPSGKNVWDDIISLEKEIQTYVHEAYEYQDNTFQSHPGYYIDYFEMRSNQCKILHNLHYEMRRIRSMPVQAKVISQYIFYLKDYVIERNVPSRQIEVLQQIFLDMEQQPLPVTRPEFESRALLYHILMDLEEFLVFKRRFVEEMNPDIRKRYWNGE